MAVAALPREQTVTLAKSFAGVAESPPNSNRTMFCTWYGMVGPWCAMFVSYVLYFAHHVNPPPLTTAKGFSYCPDLLAWAIRNGRWTTDLRRARPGDLVLYSFGGYRADHVGMVRSYGLNRDGQLETVEGNTSGSNNRDGGSVQLRNRRTSILGIVLLDYPSAAAQPQPWPRLKRTLKPGVVGADVQLWKFFMVLLEIPGAEKFTTQTSKQQQTFGAGTGYGQSAGVCLQFKKDWNRLFTKGPGKPGYLGTTADVGPIHWDAVRTCLALKGVKYAN